MKSAIEIYDELSFPFAADQIDWRLGSTTQDKSKGMALAYIDARLVMERLDSVCGSAGWQNRNVFGPGGAVICELGIKMDGEWIWKADGAGATDVEGEKGAQSDALKRAAVRFGVGRYLYELNSPWVKIVPMGKSFRIADEERKVLDRVHEEHCEKCGWGLRAGRVAYSFANQVVRHFVTDPATAADLRERNAGVIASMPVAMRKHLNETLDRVGGRNQEAAE